MKRTWLSNPSADSACSVIAEVAQSHDGSLGMAHAFVDAAADAGAEAIKFQTHIASAESTPSEPWRKAFSRQDATRYEYWQRMEFSEDQWAGLQKHSEEREIHFLSSPFSIEAVNLLRRVGVSAWKVASGEVANDILLDALAETRLPVILSTGLSAWDEVDAAVARFSKDGIPLAVLQCTTAYPCPPESVGLNLISELRSRYGLATGLSDHSATIYPGLAAATIGIQVLEVHLTLSRAMFGPDVIASVMPDELRQLVEGIRFIEAMKDSPVDKDALPESVTSLRAIFTKSVVAARNLEAGSLLGEADLAIKKPGTGIPGSERPSLVGRRLRRAVVADQLLHEDDFE